MLEAELLFFPGQACAQPASGSSSSQRESNKARSVDGTVQSSHDTRSPEQPSLAGLSRSTPTLDGRGPTAYGGKRVNTLIDVVEIKLYMDKISW